MRVFVQSEEVEVLYPLLRLVDQPISVTERRRRELLVDDSEPTCSIERTRETDSDSKLLYYLEEDTSSRFLVIGDKFQFKGRWYSFCVPVSREDPRINELYDKVAKALRTRPDFERGDGLVRTVVQDVRTKAVLMDAFMNEEAFNEMLRTGRAVYYSRTNKALWRKGEVSGNVQIVREIRMNCYLDSLLLLVEQVGGAACHKGFPSCFYRRFNLDTRDLEVIEEQVFDPKEVYKKENP